MLCPNQGGESPLMHYLLAQPPQHVLYIQYFASMIDNILIEWLVWAIVIDIVTGFFKSIITHRTTSSKGTGGLLKHAAIIILTLTVYPMLELCGLRQAGDSLVFFFFLFYLVSIIENWGQMGLPLPSWVKDHIYKLSKDYLEKEEKQHDNNN